MKRSSSDRIVLSSDSERSFDKSKNQSPKIKTSSSPITTRSRSNNEIKKELTIDTNSIELIHTNNVLSCNSSDFSVVYVDDSDATNQSDTFENQTHHSNDEPHNVRSTRNNSRIKNFKEEPASSSKYKFVNFIKV